MDIKNQNIDEASWNAKFKIAEYVVPVLESYKNLLRMIMHTVYLAGLQKAMRILVSWKKNNVGFHIYI